MEQANDGSLLVMQLDSSLLLFYPTSPVHVRDLLPVARERPEWRILAVVNDPLARVAPGIRAALDEYGIPSIVFDGDHDLDASLPEDVSLLFIGAVFEPFALELFAWAKRQTIPVAAIEEVAQLALNQNDICNYDAPFDRLFVASPDEFDRCVALGHPPDRLRISGLLAYDRLDCPGSAQSAGRLNTLGISLKSRPVVYTTSPTRSRIAIHNKDDLAFRMAALRQIAAACRQTGSPIIVKLHPNEDVAIARVAIQEIVPDAVVIGQELPIDDLFAVASVVVNRGNSQTCLESVLRRIPTVVIACGLRTLFHEAGGAYIVDSLEALSDTIVRAANQGTPDDAEVRSRHFHRPPHGVAALVAAELSALIAKPPRSNEAGWNWLIRSTLFVGGHKRALDVLGRLDNRSEWQQVVGAALQAHLEGRGDDVLKRWQECAAIDSNWFFPHYELAHGYLAKCEYGLAIRHALKAIELHPPFHGLWHEIPMREVLMAAYRAKGNDSLAEAEFELLDARSLTAIAPELQIEKAAQHCARGRLESAFSCLEAAFHLLEQYPANAMFDADLEARIAIELDSLATTYALAKEYFGAERCYRLIATHRPLDAWPQFALARIRLIQGKVSAAINFLCRIIGIPNAPRSVVERALAPRDSLLLVPHWSALASDALAPLKLMLLALYGCARALRRTGCRDWENPVTVLLLVYLLAKSTIFHRP
jgi:tetratricopeptide (TPR) repeat protein